MNARLSCLFALFVSLLTCAAAPEPSEAELAMKTEAIINLPRYVDWPEGAFLVPKSPVIIGIYGRSKIHQSVVRAAAGRLVNGRPVLVRRYHWPQRPNSHVLFIAQSERCRVGWIMKRVRYNTVLTVSELDDFLTHNGMVRMSMKDDKIRFHVSNTAAKEVGLKFSSQFLGVADQVVGEP